MALSLSSLLLLWCAELSLLASSLWLLSSTVVVVGLYLVAITSKWQTEIAYECLWACVCGGREARNHAGSRLFWSSCNTGFRESGSEAGTGFVFKCVFVYLID